MYAAKSLIYITNMNFLFIDCLEESIRIQPTPFFMVESMVDSMVEAMVDSMVEAMVEAMAE